MTDLICVGTIAGAYGVRGELRIKSFCTNPSDIETYTPLTDETGQKQFALALIGQIKSGFNARIVGIDNKEDADALKGTKLFTERSNLPSLPDDEFYYSDLIGLQVFDTGGANIGKVKTIMNNGSDDLLEIQLASSSDTTFVPFTKEVVPTVDMDAGRIVIDPFDGLLPDAKA